MTTPIPVPGEIDLLVVNNGSTVDTSPKVIVEISFPLPIGATLVLLRDGLALTAAPVQISPTAFEFADSVTPGTYNYSAEVRQGIRSEDSNVYTITVNQEFPVPTIMVYETVPVVTLFNTACPVNVNVDGSYLINIGIDALTPSGEYAIYDANNLQIGLPDSGSDSILHTEGTSTWTSYDSNSISYEGASRAHVGEQLRLVLIDPNFVPPPPPTETFFTDTVSSSPSTDAVYPSPLVAVLSVPITGPNIHWGLESTIILVEVTNVGTQDYVVGCGATGVTSGQEYQYMAPGQSYVFNLVCFGNPGDMVGAWVNIDSISVGNANFYMETQHVVATQPYIDAIPGSVVAQTIVVDCGSGLV